MYPNEKQDLDSPSKTQHTTMGNLPVLANYGNYDVVTKTSSDRCTEIRIYRFTVFSEITATKMALGIVVMYFNAFEKCFMASYFVFFLPSDEIFRSY